MGKELNCDFYFGDTVFMDLKKMDYSNLIGYKGELKTLKIRSYRWQLGISKFLFMSYDNYIITGDSSYLSYWLLLLICFIRQKKIYMWTHGLKPDSLEKRIPLSGIFYSHASGGLLLYGNHSRNFMIEKGFPENKLHVIYNSLDFEYQYNIRQQQVQSGIYKNHFRNNDPIVLFIGRLQKAKRLELIIKSQKKLIEQGIFTNTIFVGSGEMEQSLRNLAREEELVDRVWFFGPCYDEKQIAELIYNATLTVCPGNIGLTSIHSLVYGTPVITHSNFWKHGPEFEAITSGISGDFFEEGSYEDLSQKIYIWIKRSQSERETIRKDCYKIIDTFYNPQYQIRLLKKLLQ